MMAVKADDRAEICPCMPSISFWFMGRPLQVNGELWNFHSMGWCLPAFSLFHQAGGAYAAGCARIFSLLLWARNALGVAGGFFIWCSGVHGLSIAFFCLFEVVNWSQIN